MSYKLERPQRVSPRTITLKAQATFTYHSLFASVNGVLAPISVQNAPFLPKWSDSDAIARQSSSHVQLSFKLCSSTLSLHHLSYTCDCLRKNYHYRVRSSQCCRRPFLRYVKWCSGSSGARPLIQRCAKARASTRILNFTFEEPWDEFVELNI